MESVLSRAGASDIVDEPFPHLVIHDALTAEWYDQLEAAFPDASIILDGRVPESNRNYRYPASKVLDDGRISRQWKEFVRYQNL